MNSHTSLSRLWSVSIGLLLLGASGLHTAQGQAPTDAEQFRSLEEAERNAKARAKPTIYNPHFFDGPAFPLATAIKHQHVRQIKHLLAQQVVPVNYVQPGTDAGLLVFALENHRYRAAKALLEAGADPNLQTPEGPDSPLMVAAQLPVKYLRLLLKYGGNPNDSSRMGRYTGWQTPLSEAAKGQLKSVQLLIEAGANPSYRTRIHASALHSAVLLERLTIVNYLIFGKQVDLTTQIYDHTEQGYVTKLTEALRNWRFPLDSKEYAFKMKLVAYLGTKGLDYWKTPIPKRFLSQYPKEYLEKY